MPFLSLDTITDDYGCLLIFRHILKRPIWNKKDSCSEKHIFSAIFVITMIPTIEWVDPDTIKMIDQTKLPYELVFLEIKDYKALATTIKVMNIRGAPAIGVAAAMGMALAGIEFRGKEKNEFLASMESAGKHITSTRPTAVNLFWAVERIMKLVNGLKDQKDVNEIVDAVIEEAKKMAQEDIATNKLIGKHGAELIKDGDTVLTHCNAGSLATVQYGTALAPIRTAVEQGKKIQVIADETRPRLQGATLTAFELHYDKIPVKIISDNSSGLLMMLGKVQKIIVGADRITKDAVFNKIGTYMVSLAAKRHNIPFYVAAPVSTLSLKESGDDVIIEQRDDSEVVIVHERLRIAPEGVGAINYAFDRTPMDLVTGIITQDGVFTPEELLKKYL
jgi:methylthioribose-1-phosphate isomerase